MSVRPKIMTVFGVNDYTGPIPDDFWEKQIFLTDRQIEANFDLLYVKDFAFDYQRNDWRLYADVIYFGLQSDAVKGIVGLITSHDFDSDTFRALGMLYPEFFQSGYRDIPLDSLDMQKTRLRHSGPVRPCGGIEFQSSWFYPQNYYRMTPVWAFVTKWFLDSIGVETNPKQYKWMLVWEWS